MKYLIVVTDGTGDRPLDSIGGLTALQKADMRYINELAKTKDSTPKPGSGRSGCAASFRGGPFLLAICNARLVQNTESMSPVYHYIICYGP